MAKLSTYFTLKVGSGYLLKKMAADDNPDDGQLTAREWLDYAVQNVPKEMEEAAEKHLKNTGREIDFGEPTVTGQAPRAYYRREIGQPWVVGEKVMTESPNDRILLFFRVLKGEMYETAVCC